MNTATATVPPSGAPNINLIRAVRRIVPRLGDPIYREIEDLRVHILRPPLESDSFCLQMPFV
ncbi:MAG TPA: hypothetical protein VK493_03475, partial [Bryobacteraceae bacterium]|nr:hypothetical protein [Bryobacteraceae bacterium]